MSETSPTPPAPGGNRGLFLLVAVFLIGNFLYRFFVPSSEWPSRAVWWLSVGFDALLLLALILQGRRLLAAPPEDGAGLVRAAFWFGLLAGIGLFVIRLTSNSAWWTGHRLYRVFP